MAITAPPAPHRGRTVSAEWGVLMPFSSQSLHLQVPPEDGPVSLSSRINSSPDSSENLSEIPLSYKGVPPASLSLAPLKLWCYPFCKERHQCPERIIHRLKDTQRADSTIKS